MKWLRYALAVPLFLFLAFNMAAFGALVFYRGFPPPRSALMLLQKDVARDYRPIAYTQISPQLKKAVIAAEDALFFTHDGFDLRGIMAAVSKNRSSGQILAGGSTISQQLAKNLFLTPRRSFWRKGEEAVLTALLEAYWGKERILAVYLNVIEWGSGIYGAEAAAQYYFCKPAAHLSARESAFLAAVIPQPRYYQQNPKSLKLAAKARLIRRRMQSVDLPE